MNERSDQELRTWRAQQMRLGQAMLSAFPEVSTLLSLPSPDAHIAATREFDFRGSDLLICGPIGLGNVSRETSFASSKRRVGLGQHSEHLIWDLCDHVVDLTPVATDLFGIDNEQRTGRQHGRQMSSEQGSGKLSASRNWHEMFHVKQSA